MITSIRPYSVELGPMPRLTREEEYAAWERGDVQLLAKSQLPYAIQIAVRICNSRKFKDVELAISAANHGLMEALQTFDASRGFRLTTYVTSSVSWAVFREIDRHLRGCGPSLGVQKRRGISMKLVREYDDFLPSNKLGEAEVEAMKTEELAILRKCLSYLCPEDRRIVELRMDGAKYADIAQEMGFTKQRAHQRYQSAFAELSKNVKAMLCR